MSLQESFQDDSFYIRKPEVSNAPKHLHEGKSRDPFQIMTEHYLYAQSETFISYLTKLKNNILISKDIPDILSTSIIIPLLKSQKKPLNDANSYRGISILPIITKLLELVILERCPTLRNHIDSQFGFTSGASTLHAELIMQDTIRYFNSKNSPVYVCSHYSINFVRKKSQIKSYRFLSNFTSSVRHQFAMAQRLQTTFH